MELHGRRIPSDEVRAELQRIVVSREFDASECNHRFFVYIAVTNASALAPSRRRGLVPKVGRSRLLVLTIGAAPDLEETRSAKLR
jgi:hypothetical protein